MGKGEAVARARRGQGVVDEEATALGIATAYRPSMTLSSVSSTSKSTVVSRPPRVTRMLQFVMGNAKNGPSSIGKSRSARLPIWVLRRAKF